jgi:peptide-methionine (R)-S-oxide reductase
MPRTPVPTTPVDAGRRRFLGGAALSLGALALGCSRSDAADAALPRTVEIVEFSDDGERLRTATVPTVVKPDAEWRRQLSPLAWQVTRHEGTERAFTGPLLHEKRRGVFRCICCDTALFDSRTKFESGTGWPSFWKPIAKKNVVERRDLSYGMVRTEVACRRCDAHLGHVFDDGPNPTGLRYCMNSVSLRFAPA